jgi:hypothetical protein
MLRVTVALLPPLSVMRAVIACAPALRNSR